MDADEELDAMDAPPRQTERSLREMLEQSRIDLENGDNVARNVVAQQMYQAVSEQ